MSGGTLAVVVAIVLVGVAPARGQGATDPPSTQFVDSVNGLGVDEAVRLALANEPSLREARAAVDAARGMRRQAGLRPNPSVMVERRDVPRGMDAQTMASMEWPLDLHRRPGRIAVADAQTHLAELGMAERERRLASDVRSRYGAVLTAAAVLDVLTDMAGVTRRQRELTTARVENGAAPLIERDLLDVELGRLEADVHLQHGRVEASLAALRRLVAIPLSSPIRLKDTLEEARRQVIVSGRGDAGVGVRADVREAEARVSAVEARIDAVRRDGTTDVSLFGGYMRMDAGFPQLGQTAAGRLEPVSGVFHYVTGGLRMTLPFNRNQGELQAAHADRAGAGAALDAVRLSAETEQAGAVAMLDATRRAADVLATTRTTARRVLDIVSQSHDLGRATLADVLAERRRVIDVERAYVEAQGAEYDAAVMVNLAMGGVR